METDPVVIVAVLGLFAAPFAAMITWLLNRKKRVLDGNSSIAAATAVAVDAIQDVMESLRIDLTSARSDMAEFKIQNRELEHSLKNLKEQNERLLEENKKLSREIELLKIQINRSSD